MSRIQGYTTGSELDVISEVTVSPVSGNRTAIDTFARGGTPVTPVNRNRNSTNTSLSTVIDGAVISGATPSSGTRLICRAVPAGKSAGGESADFNELILKSGTEYLFLVESLDAGNELSAQLNWDEHTDLFKQW